MAKDSNQTKSDIENGSDIIEHTVDAELLEHWDSLPDEGKKAIFAIAKSWAGPLPPPEDFRKYEEALPGAADRILSLAESQQQIQNEELLQVSDLIKRRINRSFWIGLGLVVVAGIAAWNGFTGIAITLGLGGPVSTLIRTLIERLFSKE